MPDQRVLDAMLRFGLDQQSAAEVKASISALTAGLKEAEAQAQRTKAGLLALKQSARELQQVSQGLIIGGAAIVGPFIAAANAYVTQTGRAEVASRRWLVATDQIHESFISVGRVATTIIAPELEKLAALSESAAKFAQEHPDAVKAALGIGGGLVVLGALGSIAAEGIKLYADVKLLGAAALQDTAADKMLAAARLQAGGAEAGGGGAGAAVSGASVWINRGLAVAGALVGATLINETSKAVATFAFSKFEQLTGTNPNTGGVYGFEKNLQTNYGPAGLGQIGALIGAIQQLINKQNGAPATPGVQVPFFSAWDSADRSKRQTEGLAGPAEMTTAQAKALPVFQAYQSQKADSLLSYIDNRTKVLDDFQKTYWDNEASYAQTRGRTVRDYQQAEAQAQQSFNTSRARQLRDFAQSEAQTEKTYYEDRLKQAAAFNTETVRAEQDHQDALVKLQGDHADRMHDLAGARDALGLVKEQRAYEKSRAESEKQYQKDTSRRNEDYALQLADGEQAFAEQREQRTKDFEQQLQDQDQDFKEQQDQAAAQQRQRLADMDHDFKESQDKLTAQKVQRLADLDAGFITEQAHITQAFTDALTAIDPILTGMTSTAEKNFQKTSEEFGKFLDGLASQTHGGGGYCQPGYHWDNQTKSCMKDKVGGAAAGGYVGYGMRMLGEKGGEFVLSNQSMTSAERLVGGPLTQDKILAALGGGGQSFNVNLGGVSGHWGDKATALEGTLALVDQRIAEAFDQFGNELN